MMARLSYAEFRQWQAYANACRDHWALVTNEGKDGNLVDFW